MIQTVGCIIQGDIMEILLDGVSFRYTAESSVLDSITLEMGGAQVISILGPNGVGKSTLIHCINKILDPSEGTVFVDGKEVSDYSLK